MLGFGSLLAFSVSIAKANLICLSAIAQSVWLSHFCCTALQSSVQSSVLLVVHWIQSDNCATGGIIDSSKVAGDKWTQPRRPCRHGQFLENDLHCPYIIVDHTQIHAPIPRLFFLFYLRAGIEQVMCMHGGWIEKSSLSLCLYTWGMYREIL